MQLTAAAVTPMAGQSARRPADGMPFRPSRSAISFKNDD